MSLRSSERGLKFYIFEEFRTNKMVAPFVGAWIEINLISQYTMTTSSLRSSERGLKFNYKRKVLSSYYVAPFVGAWIEIVSA